MVYRGQFHAVYMSTIKCLNLLVNLWKNNKDRDYSERLIEVIKPAELLMVRTKLCLRRK